MRDLKVCCGNEILVSMIYIESILLGLSLAATPGPVFFEVIRRTMTKGYLTGLGIAFGDFMAFLLIMMLIFFGVYQFFLLEPVRLIFFIAGGLILVWIGILAYKLTYEDVDIGLKNESSGRNSIYAGFAISISNPMTIFGCISMNAYLARYASKIVIFINIILLAIGGILFFFGLASLIQITRSKIDIRYILLLSKIFGIVLIGFGISFWYQFYKLFTVA